MSQPVVIVGGGVIGLSIAFELTRRGHEIVLLDHPTSRRNASWSGAGVLLPANPATATHPVDRLCALGNQTHVQWARELRERTGIDTGLRACGGLYLARSAGETASLIGQEAVWHEEQIAMEVLDANWARRWPALNDQRWQRAVWLPGESQLRNPDHLRALKQVILDSPTGQLLEVQAPPTLEIRANRVVAVHVPGKSFACQDLCVCTGAWSGSWLSPYRIDLPTTPVRGQMLLYKLPSPPVPFIVNEGPRYLVPRDDGHVLVGSTMEEVGFDTSTTTAAIRELREFAVSLIPELAGLAPREAWSGLRPASFDGLPYLGKTTGIKNLWIATGHFRVGLQTSPATAILIADLIERKTPSIPIDAFSPQRVLRP